MASMYCVTDCSNDAAVKFLGRVFGEDFIQSYITGGIPALTAPGVGELAPVIFGGIAQIAMLFGVLLFALIMTFGLITSAQDGEVFGEGSKKVFILGRIIFSIILLVPTLSGFSTVQVFLMFLVLWSNGETNRFYNNVVSTSLANPNTSFQSVGTSDRYGFRMAGLDIVRQRNCIYVLNAVYANWMPNPSAGANQIPTTGGIGPKRYSDGQYYLKRTNKGTTTFLAEYIDDRGELGGGIANLCGSTTFTILGYDPNSLPSWVLKSAIFSSTVTLNTQRQYDVQLASLKAQVQSIKFNNYVLMSDDLNNYVMQTFPKRATDPDYDQQLSMISTEQINTIIQRYIDKTNSDIANLLGGGTNNTFAVNLRDAIVSEGWTKSAQAKQKINLVQKDINEAIIQPIVEFTQPELRSLPDDATATQVRKAVYQVSDYINQRFAQLPVVYADPDMKSIAKAIPQDFTNENISFTSVQAQINDQSSTMLNGFTQNIVETLTGTNDPNVDAMTRIQNTGTVMSLGVASMYGFKALGDAALTAGQAVAETIPGVGDNAARAIKAIQEGWWWPVITKMLDKVIFVCAMLAAFMSTVIPAMPYIFFIMAVIGWYLHIIQALAALPLWALLHMTPERSFVGSQAQGYVTLIGLFFRPVLTLSGLWLAFMLSDPTLDFATDAFFSMRGSMMPSNGFLAAANDLLTMGYWLILYCAMIVSICYLIFGLASSLPDSVIGWMGANLLSRFGETNANQALGGASSRGQQYDAPKPDPKGGGNGGSGGGGSLQYDPNKTNVSFTPGTLNVPQINQRGGPNSPASSTRPGVAEQKSPNSSNQPPTSNNSGNSPPPTNYGNSTTTTSGGSISYGNTSNQSANSTRPGVADFKGNSQTEQSSNSSNTNKATNDKKPTDEE